MIVSVFAFLCTVLIAWFATLVWRDGLIGLVVPGWRGGGIAGLAVSVIAYGMVWDFLPILVPSLAAHVVHAVAVAPRPSQRRQRQYHDGAAPQRARAFC